MEYSMWRPRTKIVAIVDMALICLGVLGLFVVVFGGIANIGDFSKAIHSAGDTDVTGGEDGTQYNAPSRINWIIGITVVASIMIMMFGLQLWAAMKLFKAASTEKDPKKTLKLARYWRKVTLVFLTLAVVEQLIEFNSTGMIITAIWKGTSLYVVSRYTDDLEIFLKRQINSRPGSQGS